MNKSLFIKKDIRKIISIKNNKSTIKFKIYNYNDASKKAIFDMYVKKQRLGYEDFSLSNEEVRLVLNMFTDCLFSLEELSEILEKPSIYMEQIMNELEIILAELVVLFIQEKTKELMNVKIESAIVDMQSAMTEGMKGVDIQKAIEDLQRNVVNG